MGYYPTGEEEFEEELRQLRLERDGYYTCKKCFTSHSKTKCPNCNSTSKRHN